MPWGIKRNQIKTIDQTIKSKIVSINILNTIGENNYMCETDRNGW